jgi:hypothetical protein
VCARSSSSDDRLVAVIETVSCGVAWLADVDDQHAIDEARPTPTRRVPHFPRALRTTTSTSAAPDRADFMIDDDTLRCCSVRSWSASRSAEHEAKASVAWRGSTAVGRSRMPHRYSLDHCGDGHA